ncbi:PA2169 family four-helix-bundle protein [Pseudomonas sp. CCI3.2]|uniref:ferritin-like domain-containing protein n=2 Tax=Pseudomonas TaxID=286 RepID=UPI002AC8F6C0|nr:MULTISPECIES: PA2169 family four-helix-bundle protein [unclassified Pseudomonas]MEB0091904.1 PA2169 family four-helix-bundle protein [Pseudomonas sp. CCI4.2]MEB0100202.1 PA2169 family four-helix-bundle protein [Pseudomonas sp. CCI3.2]MEB0121062.1 PA2169 family four-helix-bundle protein [Pseudomonas sp. CCI1.2]MEB0130100.1 PA2169 family four-helix-bundle protein [Pseudomonas sp. CCI2.4]MEB0159797.1 PA2169 family four-helix-bundle protein [Pseudomonas sp. AH2 (2023)]
MSDTYAQLNELIEITRDGQRFYEHAAEEVKDPRFKALFLDMAQAKNEVIRALSVEVATENEKPADGGTLLGKMRQMYADTKATLSSDESYTYVEQLEEAEDRILHAFEDALQSQDSKVQAVAAEKLPQVRAAHDRMRNLKRDSH